MALSRTQWVIFIIADSRCRRGRRSDAQVPLSYEHCHVSSGLRPGGRNMNILAIIASIVIAAWLSANAAALCLLLWNGRARQ
jgi:hypothetical protein